MKIIKQLLALMMLCLIVVPSQATDEEKSLLFALAASKLSGMCGVHKQMLHFQVTTKMSGGDEFIIRFWNTEKARLGLSDTQFAAMCDNAIATYDLLTSQ